LGSVPRYEIRQIEADGVAWHISKRLKEVLCPSGVIHFGSGLGSWFWIRISREPIFCGVSVLVVTQKLVSNLDT